MDHNLLALVTTPAPRELGTLEGLGKLWNPGIVNENTAAGMLVNIISNIIGLLTIVAVIWFIFIFIMGAIGWLSSGGDKTKLQNAQKQITSGLIGLVLVLSATFLIDLIANLLGIGNILSIGDFIVNINKLNP